jgi:hypothetical protein
MKRSTKKKLYGLSDQEILGSGDAAKIIEYRIYGGRLTIQQVSDALIKIGEFYPLQRWALINSSENMPEVYEALLKFGSYLDCVSFCRIPNAAKLKAFRAWWGEEDDNKFNAFNDFEKLLPVLRNGVFIIDEVLYLKKLVFANLHSASSFSVVEVLLDLATQLSKVGEPIDDVCEEAFRLGHGKPWIDGFVRIFTEEFPNCSIAKAIVFI